MALSANPAFLRAMLEERFALLVADVEREAGEAGKYARQECANQLNQSVRLLWQAADLAELAGTLADAAAQFAGGGAVLSVAGLMAKIEAVRPGGDASRAAGGRVALASAPALAAAIESREPVIAAALESEVSETLAAWAAAAGGDRVAVFPVTAQPEVPALVCAWGSVEAAAVELLAQAAGVQWQRLARAAAGGGLVSIAPAEDSWENLPAREQRLHLRAQRFARVRVSQWRLRFGASVRAGRAQSDIYRELAPQIDEARESFRNDFFAQCPSMIDYLHVEMVHSLAKDDAQRLGKDYPGPLL